MDEVQKAWQRLSTELLVQEEHFIRDEVTLKVFKKVAVDIRRPRWMPMWLYRWLWSTVVVFEVEPMTAKLVRREKP